VDIYLDFIFLNVLIKLTYREWNHIFWSAYNCFRVCMITFLIFFRLVCTHCFEIKLLGTKLQ